MPGSPPPDSKDWVVDEISWHTAACLVWVLVSFSFELGVGPPSEGGVGGNCLGDVLTRSGEENVDGLKRLRAEETPTLSEAHRVAELLDGEHAGVEREALKRGIDDEGDRRDWTSNSVSKHKDDVSGNDKFIADFA